MGENLTKDGVDRDDTRVKSYYQITDTLMESNDTLQEEVTRLRETNSMLRRVNRALRRTLDSLRNQVAAAAENDETFKAFCAGEFDAQVIESEDAGLAESGSQVEA